MISLCDGWQFQWKWSEEFMSGAVEGEAVLTCGDGRRISAPCGSSWVRPASAGKGTIEPTVAGTTVIWSQPNF